MRTTRLNMSTHWTRDVLRDEQNINACGTAVDAVKIRQRILPFAPGVDATVELPKHSLEIPQKIERPVRWKTRAKPTRNHIHRAYHDGLAFILKQNAAPTDFLACA
jgi:hypothetical protein